MPRLTRPRRGQGRVVGVAAALSDGFGVPVGLVRLVFVLTGLFGAGEIAYLVLGLLLPRRAATHGGPATRG